MIILSIAVTASLVALAIYAAWGLRFLANVEAMETEKARLDLDLRMSRWPEEYTRFILNHETAAVHYTPLHTQLKR